MVKIKRQEKNNTTNNQGWDFPGVPVVRALHFETGGMGSVPGQDTEIPCAVWGQSLVRTLRSHVPCSTARTVKTKIKKEQKLNKCWSECGELEHW